MRAIGYTGKFYTLWNITAKNVETYSESYTETTYKYFKMLGFNKDRAIAHHRSANFDASLNGTETFKIITNHKDNNLDKFIFGKYMMQNINDCEDGSYLRWYFETVEGQRKDIVKSRLIALGYTFGTTTDTEGNTIERAYSPEQQKKHSDNMSKQSTFINEVLANKSQIVEEFTKNLSVDYISGQIVGKYYNGIATFIFNNVKEYWYGDFNYALPIVNNSGKRIKGKTITINKYNYNIDSEGHINIEVIDFTINK